MMTNTVMLEDVIKASGITNRFIANQLGITEQAWRYKRKGQYQFTQSEIQKLCEVLHITKLTDKERIFFNQDVD